MYLKCLISTQWFKVINLEYTHVSVHFNLTISLPTTNVLAFQVNLAQTHILACKTLGKILAIVRVLKAGTRTTGTNLKPIPL